MKIQVGATVPPAANTHGSKPKRRCCFYVFALNLILFKHVEVAIKLLHQKSRNQRSVFDSLRPISDLGIGSILQPAP